LTGERNVLATATYVTTTYGRNGIGCRTGFGKSFFYPRVALSLAASSTLVYGFAMKLYSGSVTERLVGDAFGSGFHIYVGGTNSQVAMNVNGNTLTMTAGATQFQSWNYVEFKVVFHGSAGTMTMRVNGHTVATSTGLDTGSAPATVTPQFGDFSTAYYDDWFIDDVYILNGVGTHSNDFLDDSTVGFNLPDGDGNSSVMVGSDSDTTDNYLLVDNNAAIPPVTTEYVGSTTEGDKDTYSMDDLASTGVYIHAMEVNVYATKSDTATKYMRTVLRSGGTDYVGSSVALPLTDTHILVSTLYDDDPATSAQWTPTNYNAIEAGQEVRDS